MSQDSLRSLSPAAPLPERTGLRRPLASLAEHPEGALRPLTMMTVDRALAGWLEKRFHPGVTLLPGGWEEWIQQDLLGWLHHSYGCGPDHRWDAERQVRIFRDPDARIGLLFNHHSAAPRHPLCAVGVVAESPLTSRPDFLNRVHHEVARLHRAHLRPPYDSAERHVLAMTQDLGSVTVLQKHRFEVRAEASGAVVMWRMVEG